jgi:rare lipoprotein A
MYGMTAAHKTLPLPVYVRVTNLQNGRSVVVRANDRGPFVGNRLIDLSYSAAAKLDMLRNGTAMVEVRAIDPSSAPPVVTASSGAPASGAAALTLAAPATAAPVAAAPTATAPGASAPADSGAAAASSALFVQAGAFSDPANAERLAEKLRRGSYRNVLVREDQIAGRKMYRVRIGPVPSVAEFDRVVAALERAGIHDAHLALD